MVSLYEVPGKILGHPTELKTFMETMDIDGNRIPTPEEREAIQPLPFTIPRWVNNILVMTCTALTTVTIGIIFVLLAKHFKMKALVSGIALSTLPPPPVEALNLTAAAMASALIAPNPEIGTKVICSCPVAVIWQNILGYLVLIYAIAQYFRPITWCRGYKYNKCCTLYLFVCDIDHVRYSPLKIMNLKGHVHHYKMKYNGDGLNMTLVRSCTYDTMKLAWNGVQVMEKNDPLNLPLTVTVALRHKIMTRRIYNQLGDIQYMIRQGSSWHDIIDYYRAKRKAVKFKAETKENKDIQSPKRERTQKKKNKTQAQPVDV